jgi:PleD family two-component response regulator
MFLQYKYILAMTAQNSHSQRSIYLADDDQDDRSMFVEALLEIDSNVIVTQAQDGEQLMDILNAQPDPLPEIIFLDINMPKMDGFACLEEIKRDTKLKKLYVVMLSTSNDQENIDKAYNLGAALYAVKPNSFQGLKSLIKNVLQKDLDSLKQSNKTYKFI